MNYDELISYIVKEVLKKLNSSDKNALVMFTGTDIYNANIYNYIMSLKSSYNLKVFLSNSFEKCIGPEKVKNALQIDEVFLDSHTKNNDYLLSNIDTVIIPTLSLNSLAKIALGIRDSNISDITSKAILGNIPITILDEGLELNNYNSTKNQNYKNMLWGYVDILKGFGVKFASINDNFNSLKDNRKEDELYFKEEVKKPLKEEKVLPSTEIVKINNVVVNETVEPNIINSNVLTRSQIIDSVSNGENKILVSKATKITCLARDTAKELGVEIRCI